jgi:hypothetical protein
MSKQTILSFAEINPKSLKYSKIRQGKNKGEYVPVQNFTFQTPLMLTWGAAKVKDEQGVEKDKYDMSLQFPTADYPDADGELFLQKAIELEKAIIHDAIKNAPEWFNNTEELDEKTIRQYMMHPMLKYPKNKDTKKPDYNKSPTLKISIPHYDNWKHIAIFDKNGQSLFSNTSGEPLTEDDPTPLTFLPKFTKVIAIIQLEKLWIVSGKMSISFKLIQGVVEPPVSGLSNKVCHIRVSTKDHESLSAPPVQNLLEGSAEAESVLIESTLLEDDDEDEDETPTPTPVAVPVPAVPAVVEPVVTSAPKKKVVVGKVKK